MSRDPQQKFVAITFTRSEIAKELNEHIVNDSHDIEPFTEDDDRLTDELCEELASAMAQQYWDNDATEEWEYEVYNAFLYYENFV